MGELFNVPTLPDNFLPRPEDLATLKDAVLGQSKQAVAVTGKAVGGGRNVSIQGMGGIGKSVLATALVREPAVRQAYGDGVFWVSLGQTPNLVALQTNLATDLGDEKPSFTDVNEGKAALGRRLKDRHCLVVLDDIWDLRHYNAAFDALGEQCQLLLTTRDNSIANRLSAFSYPLEELERNKALELLQRWTNVEQLPDVAEEVVRECGYLPLALAMVGAYLRDKPQRWERVLEKLRTADLEKHKINKQLLPGYQYELFRAIQVSVEALDEVGDLTAEEVQERYFDFAVFPEDMPIPEAVLETFWKPLGLDEDDTEELLDELVDKSLLRRNEQGRLTLHDLQYDYIFKRMEDYIIVLHHRWLNAYAEKCGQGWSSGPQDDYFFRKLTWHLKKAEQLDKLYELLFDYDWLQAQLNTNGINILLADYDYLPDNRNLRLLQSTLRLSAHVLAIRPEQLTERLWGHLRDREQREVGALLEQGAATQRSIWLRPQHVNLTAPDGPMVRTLEGHSGWILSVALSQDGTKALSGSDDNTLKLWDLSTGEAIYTLEGHSNWVRSVTLSQDGTKALSGSDDNTLKLWDLSTGETSRTLVGHKGYVLSVALSQNGTQALSGSDDNTLKLWDLNTGKTIRTLEGHSDWVNSVALSQDGTKALSGSDDAMLKLWDLSTGKTIHTLEGHSGSILSVALSQDGTQALSGSDDATVKLWDLSTGKTIRTLESHSSRGFSVALSRDGTQALSGSDDKTLTLWDLNTEKTIRTLEGHSTIVKSVVISTDGTQALSAATADKTLKLWDLNTGKTIRTLEDHSDFVISVTLSQDGTQALSSSSDNTLHLWDLNTGETLQTLEGHSSEVNSVVISADGTQALSGSDDKTLRLWDLNTCKCIATFYSDYPFYTCDLSTDGNTIVAGDAAGIVHFFSVIEPGK